MKDDKKDFKLQLFKVEELPEAVCKLLLRDICRELGVSDLSLLVIEVKKVKAGNLNLPELEKVNLYFSSESFSLLLPFANSYHSKERMLLFS